MQWSSPANGEEGEEEEAEKCGEAVTQMGSHCLSGATLSIGSQSGPWTAKGGHPFALVAPEVRSVAQGGDAWGCGHP